MTLIGLKRILKSLNISESAASEYSQYNIISFNLLSDGNQYIDPKIDFIAFDFDNEFVKIKEYEANAINGILGEISINENIIKFKDVLTNKGYPFRNPQVGDIVCFFKKENGELSKTTAKITKLSYNEITLDKKISVDSNTIIVGYADSNLYENSTQDSTNKFLLLNYTPKTNYKADIYLDLDKIVSISFR